MTSELEPVTEPTVEPVTEPAPEQHRIFNERMSTEVGELAGALAKAQGAMHNGPKDKQGYGYTYLQLPTLLDIARKPLSENGIAILQSHELVKGAAPSVVTHTTVMHSSGQWMRSSLELPIHVMKQLSAAQMAGVVMTYGRRYALQSILMIGADEDSDGSIK